MRDDDQKDNGENENSRKSRSRSRSASSKKSEKSNTSYSRSRSRSRSMSRDRDDGYRLHIADIGDNVRKSDLEKFFSKFGPLKEVWMTNSSPCFGFAVYKDKKCAAEAINEADGAEICGSRIHVTYAKPRTRGSGRSFFNPNMRCYQCSYTGHFYRDCPELNGGDKRGGRYDSHYDRYNRRNRDRDRDYYYDRDYNNRRRPRRSSRRYDDYDSRRSGRRHRY